MANLIKTKSGLFIGYVLLREGSLAKVRITGRPINVDNDTDLLELAKSGVPERLCSTGQVVDIKDLLMVVPINE